MAVDLSREPVSLAEAKRHLGVRTDFRDEEIADLIVAARERVELYTGRALFRRVVTETFEAFPDRERPIVCQIGPVHEVRGVRYIGASGLVDLDDAFVPVGPIGNRWHIYAADWPLVARPKFVEVRYVAGFGPLEEGEVGEEVKVPRLLIRALLLLVGTWFENHEGAVVGRSVVELPNGVKDACQDFRPSGVA